MLRTRSTALAIALLPAAVAVVLLAAGATGRIGGGWQPVRWTATGVAAVVLLAAAGVAAVVVRARPAVTPSVALDEASAPELYRLIRDLAARLDVPPPSALALTPDCDSWLEDRTHPTHRAQRAYRGPGAGSAAGTGRAAGLRLRGALCRLRRRLVPGHGPGVDGGRPGRHSAGHLAGRLAAWLPGRRADTARDATRDTSGDATRDGARGDTRQEVVPGAGDRPDRARSGGGHGEHRGSAAPVLVIGSPFLWWMRVPELRALLAPVLAGTGPSAHPDIAAARRFVRGLDAAVAVAAAARQRPAARMPERHGRLAAAGDALRRPALLFVGRVARTLLRGCGSHASEMERGVAAAASARAQTVDYGLRIVAQEQVGLACAGWDRLLTRVALPAWRTGRWPSRLNAGVVTALTELSRRDRLAESFASRLGERPACDLLEEPGRVDEAVSLLAARLFHGGPEQPGAHWAPVGWSAYPEEVVDRIWRGEAARLFAALDSAPVPGGPSVGQAESVAGEPSATGSGQQPAAAGSTRPAGRAAAGAREEEEPGAPVGPEPGGSGPMPGYAGGSRAGAAPVPCPDEGDPRSPTLARVVTRLTVPEAGEALAARISAELAREEAAHAATAAPLAAPGSAPLPGLPAQPPRSGRELLAEHVTAAVCCAATDTAAAAPGLDWLDGPVLLLGAVSECGGHPERRADLAEPVRRLVEHADAGPLRHWLATVGVRPDKPVRLI